MSTGQRLRAYRDALRHTQLVRAVGLVRQVGGLSVQAEGLCAPVGELCEILPKRTTTAPSG